MCVLVLRLVGPQGTEQWWPNPARLVAGSGSSHDPTRPVTMGAVCGDESSLEGRSMRPVPGWCPELLGTALGSPARWPEHWGAGRRPSSWEGLGLSRALRLLEPWCPHV